MLKKYNLSLAIWTTPGPFIYHVMPTTTIYIYIYIFTCACQANFEEKLGKLTMPKQLFIWFDRLIVLTLLSHGATKYGKRKMIIPRNYIKNI